MTGDADSEGVGGSGAQAADEPRDATEGRAGLWRLLLLAAVVVGLFFAVRALGLGDRIADLRGWIEGLGPWGPVVFVVLYVLATIAMVPGSAPTVIAGGLFGTLWGTVTVSIASTLGAAACFLIARYVAREPVARWLQQQERFRRLDRLTDTHGAWIVAVTRLVPVFPFNLLNYGFGLTRVRFGTYLFFSWICMLPGTVLYVAGADAVVRALETRSIPWPLVGLLAAVLAALAAIGAVARRRLRAAEREAGVRAD